MWLIIIRSRHNVRCCLLLVTLLTNVFNSSVTATDLTLYTCADDNHWVFVDDMLQAINAGLGEDCCKSVSVTVTPSTKVIAVQVQHQVSIAAGWRGYFSDGTVVNATTWKCTTTFTSSWTSPGYVVGSEWRSPAQGVCGSCDCRTNSSSSMYTSDSWMWTDETFTSSFGAIIYCRTTLPTPCANNPCQHGGTCSKTNALSTVVTCTCPPGFTGSVCNNSVVPLTISQVSVTEVNSYSLSTVDVQVTWSVSPVPTTSQQQYYQFWVQYRPAFSESWINVTGPYRTTQNVSFLTRGVPYILRVVPVRVGVSIKNGDSSSAELTFISNCTNHYWGGGCMQRCGQCSTPQCDTITGQCVGGSNGCFQWYTGNYCNISIVTCPVQDLTVNVLNDTSAQVNWTCASMSNIPPQFYYFSIKSNAESTVINSSDQRRVTITGAQPPTGVYDMSVTVTMCRIQYSVTNCTAGLTARTSCGVPDSPGPVDVTVDSYSTDSNYYTISWTSPLYTRCSMPITYIVTVWKTSSRQKRDTAEQILVYNMTTTETFTVATLQHNNTYSVSVIAVGPQGSSAPSSQLKPIQPQPQTTTPTITVYPAVLTTELAVGLGIGIPLLVVIIVLLVLLIRAKRHQCHSNAASSSAKLSNPKSIVTEASASAKRLPTVTSKPPTYYEELPEGDKRHIYLNDMTDNDKQGASNVQHNDNMNYYEAVDVNTEHGYDVLRSN